MIRLVAVKNDKRFSKTKKENYKIGAIISNQKWKNWGKIQTKYNFCIPIYFLTSTEFVLPHKFYYGNFPYPYFERIKLINNYTYDDVTKSNIEEEKENLIKTIEDLSLLKRQIDFLRYYDYSNFIIKQTNQIKNILNDY